MHAFTTTGPERHAGPVLDRVGGLDQLVHRGLLGQGHEHHPAPLGIGEELHHVGGLAVDRPDLHRVEQAAGREQEAHRVAGGGRVEHDQVGDARPFELLDLAQHQDVAHAGHRGGDHVEGPRSTETARDPSHTVVVEVLQQCVVGGERPGPEPGPELGLLVGQGRLAEARREPRFALDLHDQHAHARRGGRRRQRRGDRRLADPTLARHDHDPGGCAEALEVHGHRCYGSPRLQPDAHSRTVSVAAPLASRSRPARRRAVALVALVVAACLLVLAGGAGAASGAPVGRRGIDVVQIEGYLDAPNVSLMRDAIRESNANRSTLLVFQINSSGAIGEDITPVLRTMERSRVPIAVWVGPSGADAKGAATLVLQAADLAYVSPNSGAGAGQPVRVDDPGASTTRGVADRLAALASRNDRDPDGARKLAANRLGSAEAAKVGATNGVRPTLGELIVQLDGKTVHDRGRRREALHRQGRGRGSRPPPPAQPGRRVQPPRARRVAAAPPHQPVDRLPAHRGRASR